MVGIAQRFARFAGSDIDFPVAARSLAVDGITDAIGCMLAGAREPLAQKLRAIVPIVSEPQGLLIAPCPVWGDWTSPADAAFLGATLDHALDYDDVNHPGMTHPSTIMVPTLLAASAVAPKATGRDLVRAYLIGIELLGKLGALLNPALFERGWHPTPTLGPPVVALAASTFLGLDEPQTVAALGLAATGSGGLRANFGTMTKPYHAGQAARTGLTAALLARKGYTSSPEAFEHRYGYLTLFGGGKVNAAAMGAPGSAPEILSPRGLDIKPYPACAAGQPVIEAGIVLHRQSGGATVRRATIRTGAPTLMPMIHRQPAEPLEGKFSLPFCLAAALIDGEVKIDTFTAGRIADPALRALVDRVDIEIDPTRNDDFYFGVSVTIETEDGARFSHTVPRALGTSNRRLPEAILAQKFRDCAHGTVDPVRAERLWRAFRTIDSDVSVATLAALLAGA